jgi:hypothetical protein
MIFLIVLPIFSALPGPGREIRDCPQAWAIVLQAA